MNKTLPSSTRVLVIGGGPAGSYAASVLARENMEVVLLEASQFPRYHIGESLLPSVRPFLRFIDAEQKIIDCGFQVKPGAAVKFNQNQREGYTDFIEINPDNGSWNVIRSEFDEILLRHAEHCGANVFEKHRVTSLKFAPDADNRPVGAVVTRPNGEEAEISFDYLVDASGRAGIMSTKYLRNRVMNQSLKNVACWGYWTGHGRYGTGTARENAPWFEALSDCSGWGWFIPLHNGTVSVGFVLHEEISAAKKEELKRSRDGTITLKGHYMQQLDFTPGIKKLLTNATLKEDATVRSASDYSYSASNYAGDHFRLVGDASAFIDPFFSSGVHLALAGGLSAATSIVASIRDQCSEREAAEFHNIKVGVSYTRFLLVVLSAYKQIREQDVPVLRDVNEDNFDRAFNLIRPVIQGTVDVNKKLSEDDVQKTMYFLKDLLAIPTSPEMYKSVEGRMKEDLLSSSAPIMTQNEIERRTSPHDEDARNVLKQANARKVVHPMYSGPANLAMEEAALGFVGHIQVGSLGLVRISDTRQL